MTFTGSGRFFAPFGETHAVQAQGEYMYHGAGGNNNEGRQEGQFDLGLVNRFGNLQAGLFSSFKYVNMREFQSGDCAPEHGLCVPACCFIERVIPRRHIGFAVTGKAGDIEIKSGAFG